MTQRQGLRCVAITGNPRPASRTKAVVDAVARQLGREIPQLSVVRSFDLATATGSDLDGVRAAMKDAHAVVVGSPTYKGTFTALLKSVFDGLGADDLRGVVAIPVMVAGSPLHAHGSNSYLRPLLEEVGAVVPLPGRCWLETELEDLDAVVAVWGGATGGVYRQLLSAPGVLTA